MCTNTPIYFNAFCLHSIISPRSSNCFLQSNERGIRIQLKFRLKYQTVELQCSYFQLYCGLVLGKPQLVHSFGIFFPQRNDLTLLSLLPGMPFFTHQPSSCPQTLLGCRLFYKARLLEPVVRINHSLIRATRMLFIFVLLFTFGQDRARVALLLKHQHNLPYIMVSCLHFCLAYKIMSNLRAGTTLY